MPTLNRRRPGVKRNRAYDGSQRREAARQSRERILVEAEKLFVSGGFAGTTIGAVAGASGVSVDTIYKTFGGKPGLIRGIRDRALRGEGPIAAEQRSDELQLTEPDPRRIIRGWGDFVTELAPRGAPILLLLRDASKNDPELGALLRELDDHRLRRMTANARRLQRGGHLRRGVSVEVAAKVLWTYSSAELYELVVIRGGMPLARYGEFVADAMIAALL